MTRRRRRNKLTRSNLEYYFAYGSNMDEDKLKIKRRINFYKKFSGKIDGWEIVFDESLVVLRENREINAE